VDIPATSDNIPGTLVLRDASGGVKIGVASPAPHVTAPLTVSGSSPAGGLVTYSYTASAGIANYRANGTPENPTQVLSGQRFAFFVGGTYGTTQFANPAAINFIAAENQTDTARGSFITFETCAPGQITRQERARIKETGQIRFQPLAADPAGAEAGDVYYNSSSNKLKVYNGTSWVDLH
jgi:hypothetical protein